MLWRPDTCVPPGCELEYDGANEAASFKGARRLCPAHAALVGSAQHDVVLAENQRKNRAVGLVAEQLNTLVNPQRTLTLSAGQIGWRHDVARILTLTIPATIETDSGTRLTVRVSGVEKNTIRTALGTLDPTIVLE